MKENVQGNHTTEIDLMSPLMIYKADNGFISHCGFITDFATCSEPTILTQLLLKIFSLRQWELEYADCIEG